MSQVSTDLSRIIVNDYIKSSWPCVEALVKELAEFKGDPGRQVELFRYENGRRIDTTLNGEHFFLRASVEYSNPQMTVEEIQGVIAARLLEVCGNYFLQYGLREANDRDIDEICEILEKPSVGIIIPFLLNTDDIEADRYSMNPLKESIVTSGQSAFPSANVKTQELKIDRSFAGKYEGSLICSHDLEQIARHLDTCGNSYMDMVDAVKYEQMEDLSGIFGIDLCVYSKRLPLTILQKEATDGLLHHIIEETHKSYQAIECVYRCMGRSMKNLTTLLTVPHSEKGYGSKRAAKGKIHFDGARLKNVKVDYRTVPLYPNAIDPDDVSIAKAEDSFTIEEDRLVHYDYNVTPSSPQFLLYSLASPENAVLWHGIGAFGATELLKSYTTTRLTCAKNTLIRGLNEKYGTPTRIPLQFNLVPKHMWFHPVHRNIDASIRCIQDMRNLADLGMKMEHLQTEQYIRKQN